MITKEVQDYLDEGHDRAKDFEFEMALERAQENADEEQIEYD